MSESSQGVGSRKDLLLEHAREIEQRDREEIAKRFAQALAPHVVVQAPPQLPTAASADPPGGWRAGDGVLTQPSAPEASANTAAASSGTDEADANERVIVNVETRDLGRVSLVLDRNQGAVRVVIGVENASGIERMLPEREALVRQLQVSGLTVQSVQFVSQNELGTVLAPSPSVGRQQRSFATSSSQTTPENEKVRRRGSRKLNLIG